MRHLFCRRPLEQLADRIESRGIKPAFEELKSQAPEDLHVALDECRLHILGQCETAPVFKEKPMSCYSPVPWSETGQEIPDWWSKLTLSAWRDIFDNAPTVIAGTGPKVECTNAVLSGVKGLPLVVQSCAGFLINYTDTSRSRSVKISRKVGRRAPVELGTLDVPEKGLIWGDSAPPNHDAHLEYIFFDGADTGVDTRPVKQKLVVLDSYEIGVVAYCRNAVKNSLFRQVRKRGVRAAEEARKFECALELPGAGSYQLDLYTANGMILGEHMNGIEVSSEKDVAMAKKITSSSATRAVCVIETDEECRYIFKAALSGAPAREFCINIEAGDDAPLGVNSEPQLCKNSLRRSL